MLPKGHWVCGIKATVTTIPRHYSPFSLSFSHVCKVECAEYYMISQRVGKIPPWGRKWQPTPVFLPGEFHEPDELQSMGSQSQTRLSD